MNRLMLMCSVFVAVCLGMTDAAYARRMPLPIVFGWGEDLTNVGELPPEVARQASAEVGTQVQVAFLSNRLHLFWLPIWTWNGRHVLRSGDRYWDLPAASWDIMIGGPASAKYSTPLWYSYPPGAVLLGVLAAWMVGAHFYPTEEKRLAALNNDKRYHQALQTLFPAEGEGGRGVLEIDERRFQQATAELIAAGVDSQVVEANLRRMAEGRVAQLNAWADQSLAAAAEWEKRGQLDQGAEVYSTLAQWLPLNDERQAQAEKCLAAINDRRAAGSASAGSAESYEMAEEHRG